MVCDSLGGWIGLWSWNTDDPMYIEAEHNKEWWRGEAEEEGEEEEDGELDSVILAITLGELDADQLTVANGTTNLGTLVLEPHLDATWRHVQTEGKLYPGHVGGHGVDQELLLKDVELSRRRTLALLAERKGIRTSGLDSHLL